MTDRITVLYTCHKCGLLDATASVRAKRPDAPFADWFAMALAYGVRRAHRERSPQCKGSLLVDIKVPVGQNGSVAELAGDDKPFTMALPESK